MSLSVQPAWVTELPPVEGRYAYNSFLSEQTWFRVGGPAQVLFKPKNRDDLVFFLKNKPKNVPVTILGAGSNVLVRDGGIEGVVIRLVGKEFSFVTFEQTTLHAGSGALDRSIALHCRDQGISGMEFLVGIPGTIGGGVRMNAGAYGRDLESVFQEAEAIDEAGNIHHLTAQDITFSYRHSTLPKGWIITSVKLRGVPEAPETIQFLMAQFLEQREVTQPVRGRTGGSTFKNPEGGKAWQLIDQTGCRGMKEKGAEVSEKHCNFLLNTGGASAYDLETLGEAVRQRVLGNTGVSLEWEIIRLGKHKQL